MPASVNHNASEEESPDLAQFLAAWYTMHDSKSNLCKLTSRIFSSYYSALRLRTWLPWATVP